VDEDAGRVQHTPERGAPGASELVEHGLDERARLPAGTDVLARSLEDSARSRDDELVRLAR
jgi:hypothetical protein